MRVRPALMALSTVSLLLGCFEPSSERARQDLEVGNASGAGVGVQVQGGLAAVRSLTSGSLVLWASAPSISADLELGSTASSSWTIELQNAMPAATLRASDENGEIAVQPLDTLIPTNKRWQIDFTPPARVSLRIATPEAHTSGPFRFAVLSDVQEAVDRVQDIFDRMNHEDGLAFVFTAGDLTERGTSSEMDEFQQELRSLTIPMYGTLGNHDAFDAPTPWHGRFGRCNLHFSYRGVAFTALDSADGTIDPTVYDWLKVWLEAARQRPHVFATHIPALDPIGVRGGGFASRNEAAKLLSMLAGAKVDVTFYGHIHSYYAFDNAGIPAYISGGGGAIPERFDGIGRHFLVVETSPEHGIDAVKRIDVD